MTAPPDFGQQVREVAHSMKEEGVVYLLIGKGAAIAHNHRRYDVSLELALLGR